MARPVPNIPGAYYPPPSTAPAPSSGDYDQEWWDNYNSSFNTDASEGAEFAEVGGEGEGNYGEQYRRDWKLDAEIAELEARAKLDPSSNDYISPAQLAVFRAEAEKQWGIDSGLTNEELAVHMQDVWRKENNIGDITFNPDNIRDVGQGTREFWDAESDTPSTRLIDLAQLDIDTGPAGSSSGGGAPTTGGVPNLPGAEDNPFPDIGGIFGDGDVNIIPVIGGDEGGGSSGVPTDLPTGDAEHPWVYQGEGVFVHYQTGAVDYADSEGDYVIGDSYSGPDPQTGDDPGQVPDVIPPVIPAIGDGEGGSTTDDGVDPLIDPSIDPSIDPVGDQTDVVADPGGVDLEPPGTPDVTGDVGDIGGTGSPGTTPDVGTGDGTGGGTGTGDGEGDEGGDENDTGFNLPPMSSRPLVELEPPHYTNIDYYYDVGGKSIFAPTGFDRGTPPIPPHGRRTRYSKGGIVDLLRRR